MGGLFNFEIAKWIIVAVGAVVSFYVIDLGKLRLEEFRSRAENQRSLLTAYLNATEAVQPDVWKRKLRVLQTFSDDARIREWAAQELEYIENFAALDALYVEAMKVAAQLVSRTSLKDPKRDAIRARYEQLYWADLPFYKESKEVESAMVAFRSALEMAEANPASASAWQELNGAMIKLSGALRESQHSRSANQPAKPPQ
jgi:hypothetical protein